MAKPKRAVPPGWVESTPGLRVSAPQVIERLFRGTIEDILDLCDRHNRMMKWVPGEKPIPG